MSKLGAGSGTECTANWLRARSDSKNRENMLVVFDISMGRYYSKWIVLLLQDN
jgi:hypothetical protein